MACSCAYPGFRTMWHPNKQQWLIIVLAIVAGVLGGDFGRSYGPFYATMAMLIGGLMVWMAK